ncbi:MAG: GNAT family N-acetyltransferase [Candidatus Sumerlaeia bacterium]
MIEYSDRADDLSVEMLKGFFRGWPHHPDPETHLKILKQSAFCWTAREGECCVWFINAVSDGVFYAAISLLEVLPAYQGRGIGRELLRLMLENLREMYAVDLVCDEKLVRFYEKAGLQRHCAMVLRRYENQDGRAEYADRAGPEK